MSIFVWPHGSLHVKHWNNWCWACVQVLWLSCWQVQRTLLCLDLHPVELRVEQATAGQSRPNQSSRPWSKCCRISACLAERSSSSCSYLTVCQAERLDRSSTPLLDLQQIDLPGRKASLGTRFLHIYKHKWVNRINTKTVMLPWQYVCICFSA